MNTKKIKGTNVVVPEHAVMPTKRRKPGDPYVFTHVGIAGFKYSRKEVEDGAEQTGFVLRWGAENLGWGELDFKQCANGTIECRTECMSKAFVEAALKVFVEKLTILE